MQSAQRWADGEFGAADLGDARRTRRLVRVAAEVASRPAGTVTQACASSASREGAFRLLENGAVRRQPIAHCVHRAALGRCQGRSTVFVAVDATSLHITDNRRDKGIGSIGTVDRGSRGVHAMTALAVGKEGLPLGIVGQKLWVRDKRSQRGAGRPQHGGESSFWREVIDDCREAFARDQPEVTPWYQLDRGGDCWQVLTYAADKGLLLTVRATHDRRLLDEQYLWSMLERAKVRATSVVEVSARPPTWMKQRIGGRRSMVLAPARRARKARLSIRAATVSLRVVTPDGVRRMRFNAVLARESNRPAKDRVEWLLLTTHSITTRSDMLAVVHGYTMRWRVEDFHRVWKRGLCNVEDTQLRSREAIYKWATILGAVATRALRLTNQARLTPDAPATTEFSESELDALRRLRSSSITSEPTLAEAVRWLAELGGYTGPWNGPPGATVIGRGLHDLSVAVRALGNSREKR
jgi:hypothetical protein